MNKYTYERCPHCDEEVKLDNKFIPQVCLNCEHTILPCSICDLRLTPCEDCPLTKKED